MDDIQLFSYKITHDKGFSPNPFHGVCTLACCKPGIRKNIGKRFEKQKGNFDFWVIGISSLNRGKDGNKLVYMMKVTEVKTFGEYFKEYPEKRPIRPHEDYLRVVGDNIYKPLKNGEFEQLASLHSKKDKITETYGLDEKHYKRDIGKDLEANHVLISRDFYYFGANPLELPKKLRVLYQSEVKKSPFRQKFNFSDEIKMDFLDFLKEVQLKYPKKGLISMPYDWKGFNITE